MNLCYQLHKDTNVHVPYKVVQKLFVLRKEKEKLKNHRSVKGI